MGRRRRHRKRYTEEQIQKIKEERAERKKYKRTKYMAVFFYSEGLTDE